MITITSSSIVSTATQVDGRSYVIESHIASDGRDIRVEYLADVGLDTNAVLLQRAANIQADLQAKEAVDLAAQNYEIPLTPMQFLERFTLQERIAIRAQRASNPAIDDYLDYLDKVSAIYRNPPLGQKTIDGLNYLVSLGLLTADRPAAILAP